MAATVTRARRSPLHHVGNSRRCAAADFIICVVVLMGLSSAPSLCHAAPSPSPPAPGIASCSAWTPNSVQNVTVDGFARFDAAEGCEVKLINVSVTFFALPQATIVLDGWSLRGGSVAIQGPPNTPWSIRDVAVIVTNSVIETSGGPAVSVVLGAGYTASVGAGVVLRNVSLYCSGSRLWSGGRSDPFDGQITVASVLSVLFLPTIVASALNVNIDNFTVVAVDSDLRSEVTASGKTASASVASVAAAQYGRNGGGTSAWMTVSNSVLYVVRCNATAVVSLGTTGVLPTFEAAAVSAVAGIAFGKLLSVALTVTSTTTVVTRSRSLSAAIISSTLNSYAASTVAGATFGYTSSRVTITDNSTFFVGWSDASSGASSSTRLASINVCAGSSVAGVAMGWALSNAPMMISNGTTFYLGWSNATSSSNCDSTADSIAYSASSIAGVAIASGDSDSPVTIANSTSFSVGWSNATSTSSSTGNNHVQAGAGSSIAGVATAQFNAPVTITSSTTFYVGWSNANSTSTSISGNAFSYANAGSSVAGVALGLAHMKSPVTIANSAIAYVEGSNATSTSSGTSTTDSNACAGSTVAGVAVGFAYSDSSITTTNNATFYVWLSNVTNACSSTAGANAYAASSVGGVTLTLANLRSAVTITESTTFYVGWSHVNSTCTTTSSTSHAYAGSSVAGVVVGQAVGNSDTNSLLAYSVTSAAFVSACASGITSAAVSCLMAAQSAVPQLCCTRTTAPNGSFPIIRPLSNDIAAVRLLATAFDLPPRRRTPTRSLTTTPSTVTLSTSSEKPLLSSSKHASASSLNSMPLRISSNIDAKVTVTRALSGRRSGTPTPEATTALFRTSPAPSNARLLGLDSAVVTAVVALGYGSTAVAAALSPTSGNKASVASHLVSGAECTLFGGDDLSSFPQPDDWSLMPGFIESSLGIADDSGASAAAAKILTTVVLMVISCAANAAWLARRGSMSADASRP